MEPVFVNPCEPNIFVHEIDFEITDNLFHSLCSSVRKNKRERILKFRFREDALRGLFGELLLKFALEKTYNISYSEDIFNVNQYGKPFVKGGKIQFNISHSGNWVGVVLSDSPAGIDIEKIVDPPYEIMPRNFNKTEIEQILCNDESERANRFYSMWTLKESYIKMHGKGLSLALDSFSIDMNDPKNIKVSDKNCETENVRFMLSNLGSDHILAVCLKNFHKEIPISSIPLNRLTNPK